MFGYYTFAAGKENLYHETMVRLYNNVTYSDDRWSDKYRNLQTFIEKLCFNNTKFYGLQIDSSVEFTFYFDTWKLNDMKVVFDLLDSSVKYKIECDASEEYSMIKIQVGFFYMNELW